MSLPFWTIGLDILIQLDSRQLFGGPLGKPDAVIAIAIWVVGEVVLVFLHGGKESSGRADICGDGLALILKERREKSEEEKREKRGR